MGAMAVAKAAVLCERNPMRTSLFVLLLSVGFCAARERGLPPQQGIANFGKINDSLFRGAQPDAVGITNLARLGIKSIINLRMSNESWKAEESVVHANGITYTNVPMRGVGRPTDVQVATLLGLIETLPAPVFVHCRYGCDRVGTIIACYRVRHDHWSNQAALEEARKYGLSLLEQGMINYVREFDKASNKK